MKHVIVQTTKPFMVVDKAAFFPRLSPPPLLASWWVGRFGDRAVVVHGWDGFLLYFQFDSQYTSRGCFC